MSLDWADNRLTLRAGKSRFALQTLPAEDFPLMSVGNDVSATFSLTQETFKTMLSQVQYSMAVQDIRYYLNGFADAGRRQPTAPCCNRRPPPCLCGQPNEAELPKTEVILPRKTVLELFKLLNNPSESITVELLDNQVRFQCNGTTIVSKVIDGKFPDFNRWIPLDNDKIFLVSRTQLFWVRSNVPPFLLMKNSAVRDCSYSQVC